MSRVESVSITASSVSRFINDQLGYGHTFTVRQALYIEVAYDSHAADAQGSCLRLMQELHQNGYIARHAPHGAKILVLGKERPKRYRHVGSKRAVLDHPSRVGR